MVKVDSASSGSIVGQQNIADEAGELDSDPSASGSGREKLRVLVAGAGIGGLAVARGLLRAGCEVTVFERGQRVRAGGGAVTIWPNGAAVLEHLGVDMRGAGQRLSSVRVRTNTGQRIATIDVDAINERMGGTTRMVPRQELVERLLRGIPADRIRCDSRVMAVTGGENLGVRARFDDGTIAAGDVLVGADGKNSVVRTAAGAPDPISTGWCSWQGLSLLPEIQPRDVAWLIIGEAGNLGVWPAGDGRVQWWFDSPWGPGFERPESPIAVLRTRFAGWCDAADHVLAALSDDDLIASPYPHFRHPIPRKWGRGGFTLLGDAAHTMPPTLAQGANQALLDTMVLCHVLSQPHDSVGDALRRYERTRRRPVSAVSWVTARQVAHGAFATKPAALIPDALSTWMLGEFMRKVSHPRLAFRAR